jgi:VCBS repeat-containing protein
VGPTSQSITVADPADQTYGDVPVLLNATATSELPVSYRVVSGPASVEGVMLQMNGAGTVVVEASQAGNSNYQAAPPVTRSFNVAPATLVFTADDQGIIYGEALPAFTGRFTGFVNGDHDAQVTTPPTFAVAPPLGDAGAYTISTSGAAAANYQIDYVPGTLFVVRAYSVVALSPASTAIALGATATLSVSVAASEASAGTPTGFVTFFDDGAPIGRVLLSSGVATLTRDDWTTGAHPLTAAYEGDVNFAPNASDAATLTVGVDDIILAPSRVTMSSASAAIAVGDTVTLNVSVAALSGDLTPTGVVKFLDDGVEIGRELLSGGVATLTRDDWTIGVHPLTAEYEGDVNFAPNASDAVTLIVNFEETGSALTEANAGLTAAGALIVRDLDVSNMVSATVQSVAPSGTTVGLVPDNEALLAMITVALAASPASPGDLNIITWTFNSGQEAFDYLPAGSSLVLTYTVRATDASSAFVDQSVVITINGSNDAPQATASSVTNQNTPYRFAVSDFHFTDAEGNAAASITIGALSLAAGDSLRLNGVDVTNGQTIPALQIPNLVYTPATGASGAARSSFNFTVNDSLDTGTIAATMTINVKEGAFVYIDFGPSGFWRWSQATGYQQLHSADVDGFSVGFDGFVYVDFGTFGLWRWSQATGYQQLHRANAENVQAGPDNFLYIDFGPSGFWRWSQAAGYQQLHSTDVDGISVGFDGFVYVDFGAFGLWRWSQASGYQQLHRANVENVQAGPDGFLYIDFGPSGFWRWSQATGYQQLHSADVDGFSIGFDGFVYVDFGAFGLWRWSQATGYQQHHRANVENVQAGPDGFLYIDFGLSGFWRWSQATGYQKLHPASPERIDV